LKTFTFTLDYANEVNKEKRIKPKVAESWPDKRRHERYNSDTGQDERDELKTDVNVKYCLAVARTDTKTGMTVAFDTPTAVELLAVIDNRQ